MNYLSEFKAGRAVLLFPFLLCLLSACTTIHVPDQAELSRLNVPTHHEIAGVPVIEQEDHFCGPAALASIAQYNGTKLSQEDAAELVYTPGRKGTFQHDIVSAFQRQGYITIPISTYEEAVTEIAADHPVMIFQNLALKWVPMWHYSILSGYDLNDKEFLVHGGRDEAIWQAFKTVGLTWKRAGFWGYVAVPAGEVVPSASEAEMLQAIAGIETAGFQDEAERAYQTVLKSNSQSDAALFGLGNISMARENYKFAEEFYRQALVVNAENYFALNNLAYSLDKQGEHVKACVLLEKNLGTPKETAAQLMLEDTNAELCSSH